ncbi:AMP-binding protein [bacterium]|nr:AMP-binding protein [bacterium]
MSAAPARLLDLAYGGRLRGRALTRHRLRKLRAMIRHATGGTDFYRDLYADAGVDADGLRSLADLARVPILRREHVDESRLVVRGANLDECITRRTGGSTGRALALVTYREDFRLEAMGWIRTWRKLGMRWRDRHAALKEPEDTYHEGKRRPFQRAGFLVVNHFDLYRDPAELAGEIVALRPDVLRGPASALDGLAHAVERGALRPRLVFSTGERLDPAARERMRNAFGRDVHDLYGATEAGCVAWRCPACGEYHVNADRAIVEIVDEAGHPVPPGESGEVLLTNLVSRAMPILRYAVGDRARRGESRCRHARDAESFAALEGRTVEQIVLAGGRIASPYEFMPDDVPGIRSSMAEQVSPDAVRILVVPDADFLAARLDTWCAEIAASLDHAVRVTWEQVDRLPDTPAERLRRVVVRMPPTSRP